MTMRKPEDIVNIKIRCKEGLRAKLEEAAKKNVRSLNSEIVYRLGVSFGVEGVALITHFQEIEKESTKIVREMITEILKRQEPPFEHDKPRIVWEDRD